MDFNDTKREGVNNVIDGKIEQAEKNESRYKRKKVGVVGDPHSANIDNNLLKYSMFIILKEFDLDPYIIGYIKPAHDISFLNKTVNLRIINNAFKEINENEYDFLVVNSEKSWEKLNEESLDINFLNFAKKWDTPKIIYGALLGMIDDDFTNNKIKFFKKQLKNINVLSFKEKSAIQLFKKYLNYEPSLVLDPTLLIDNKYYKDLIKDYKGEFTPEDNYIFIYRINKIKPMEIFIKNLKKQLNYKLYNCHKKDSIEKFLYGIINCKAVVTNSYYGVIFSLIFNKPYICFNKKKINNDRYDILKDIEINNRYFEDYKKSNISLLTTPLNINQTLLNELKKQSLKFLKDNLI